MEFSQIQMFYLNLISLQRSSIQIDPSFFWSSFNIILVTRISHLSLAASVMEKIDLAPPPPFDPHGDPSSLSQWWKIWTKRFQMYKAAMNITNDKQKRHFYYIRQEKQHKKYSKHSLRLGKTMLKHKPNQTSTFLPRKMLTTSISILSNSPAVRWSRGLICHQVAKASSDLWISGCDKRNKVSGNSELPLQTITTICITRRRIYPW